MTMQKDISLFAQSYKQEEESDLQRYWRMIKLHKWGIVGFVTLVVGLTAFYVYSKQPIYRASTTVLIENQEAKVLSIEEVYGLNAKDQEYYLTQFEILKSRDLAERVVRSLELNTHPLFDPRQQAPSFIQSTMEKVSGPPQPLTDKLAFEKSVDQFIENLSIVPVRNTQLVRINFDSADPKLAATVTDTIAAQYIKHHMEEREGATLRATDWLSERLEDLRITLQQSEQGLQNYREEAELVDVSGVQTLGADEIAEITQRFVDARERRSSAQTLYNQVKELGADPTPAQLMSIPSILSHDLVRNFKRDKAVADARVTELSKRYGPKHPRMIAARAEAEAADIQLYQQILSVADGIQSDYFAALKTERALQGQLASAKETLQDVNRKEIKLRELEREVETNRKLFNMFLTRAKETEEAQGLQSQHARVVDSAVEPQKPIAPKKSVSLVIALFLSTVFSVGIALLKESMRNTVRTGDDVESKLGCTLLGFLPNVKSNRKQTTYRGFEEDEHSHFAEAMRSVRTAFVLSSMDDKNKVVLVTSSVPNEGKSTVALNMAEALGRMENVLLIDADMRRPSLTSLLGVEVESPGLSSLISGNAGLKESIRKLKNSNVSVLTTGSVKGINPLEIVSSKRLAKLVEQLGQHYDRIIIDSPPIHAVSDGLVLSTYADSVVFVVKSDDTSTVVASRAIKNLKSVGARIAGVVLNKVDIQQAANYGEGAEHYFADYGYTPVSNTRS